MTVEFKISPKWDILIKDLKLDPTYILHSAGLPLDLFNREHASLTPPHYFALWSVINSSVGIGNLAITLGTSMTESSICPAYFSCLCCRNLEDALTRLAQYETLVGPVVLSVMADSNRLELSISCPQYDDIVPQSFILYKFVVFTQIARVATRRNINPEVIKLKHIPENSRQYTAFFSAPIIQSIKNTITFNFRDYHARFITEDEEVWQIYANKFDKEIVVKNKEKNIMELVRIALLRILPRGCSSLQDVAQELIMSKRTLQRKLNQEKKSFQGILEMVRLELACHYLVQTDIPIKEIGYLLSYRDFNAFSRAFKKWAGHTPTQYRRNLNICLK